MVFVVGRAAIVGAALVTAWSPGCGQDLAPRAYLITPIGGNAVTLAYSYNSGSVFVNPAVPVQNLAVQFHTPSISYYHSFALWKHSSNITLLMPYVTANAQATVQGTQKETYRSGLADSRIRFALNLKGGPALSPEEFSSWRENTLIGISFTAGIPASQYDGGRLINIGTNRWSFRPELGLSKRWGNWTLESSLGAWFFLRNGNFFPGNADRTQQPIGSSEAHLTHYLNHRFWTSLDGNFWVGGRSKVNGQINPDEERDSRVGVTAAVPITRHQSLKISYALGAYIRIGGNYKTFSTAWQYSWLSNRK